MNPAPAMLFAVIFTDPIFTAGLRQRWQLLRWSKANEQRKELI